MLSKSAFNALLKTLEEPPTHVKFIFATTEVKKIPITIISRCQRFDLHRIKKEELTLYFKEIAKKESIQIDDNAIALIVRFADGSFRDGLSFLDQAISNQKDKITADVIISMLGLADKEDIFDLLDAIFNGNAVNSLEIFNRIYDSGADIIMIFDEILNIVHFITQIKITPELKDDIQIPDLERLRGFKMSEKISMSSLGIVWQILYKGYEELQSGFHLLHHAEMIILRLIYLYDGPTPDDLIKKKQSEILKEKNYNQEKNDSINEILDNPKISQLTYENKILNPTAENQSSSDIKENLTLKSFRHFVNLFYQKREGMLHTHLYNNTKIISFKEGEVIINATSISDPHFTRTIAKLVSKWTGRIWQVSSSTSNIGQTLYEEDLINQQKEIEIMKDEGEIKNILETFPGTKIHSITNINETTEENKSIEAKKTKEK